MLKREVNAWLGGRNRNVGEALRPFFFHEMARALISNRRCMLIIGGNCIIHFGGICRRKRTLSCTGAINEITENNHAI